MSSVSLVGVARGLALGVCAVTVLLDFRAEPGLASANRWCSGMKTATKMANKTAQAPNRKGGPGMSVFCRHKERNNTEHENMTLYICLCVCVTGGGGCGGRVPLCSGSLFL